MKCEVCGGQMKPLFQSWFCPRDCDRKPPSTVDDDWDQKTPTRPMCGMCGSPIVAVNGLTGDIHCGSCGATTPMYRLVQAVFPIV